MASQQYTSIIRLLEHCGIATDGDLNLLRIRKQLLAEFSMAQSGFIEVDEYSYSRNDVFEEIDRPDFLKRLIFHRQIWNSPPMLALLEHNAIDLSTIKDHFKPFWGNKVFDEFFSPYFAGPFNSISRTILAEMYFGDLGYLMALEDFLAPAEREEAFRPVRIFLDDKARLLRNVNRDNYKIMRPKIADWIDTEWYPFFNSLPNEFYEVKNAIINQLINIGVAVQKTHRRDCRKMSEQLVQLYDAPENLRSTILSNHAVYTRSRGFSFSGRSPFWIIWIVIMVVRAVASGSCNNSKDDYQNFRPSNINSEYLANDSLLFRVIKDSTSKINASDTIPMLLH
ncbi:MAG: hypothetical protein ABI683_10615 [Ginsengibacter sp.]